MSGTASPRSEIPPGAGLRSVAIARSALEALLAGRDPEAEIEVPEEMGAYFDRPRGAFVTLLTYPDGQLRGCVGFPRPVLPLRAALPRAAGSAALDDPRFPPIRARDLPHLLIEVSLLTEPMPMRGSDRDAWPAQIRIGRDGLIVEEHRQSGLLLPQVAPDQGWDAEQFLAGTCVKAGLAANAWRRPSARVLIFEALVFRETRPGGEVVPHAG